MSADEMSRMELARRAWQATAPSDDEVRRAVRRIRLSADSPRRGAVRRLPALAAAALVLGGALAYAANGGYSALVDGGAGAREHSLRGGGPPAAPVPTADEHRSGVKAASPAVSPPAAPEPPAPTPPHAAATGAPALQSPEPAPTAEADRSAAQPSSASAVRASEGAAPARPSSRGAGAGSADSGWRQVGEALAAGDEARATRALNGLARDADPETRAKAELGLARLAASSGNCERARRLALSVARRPGLDDKLIGRAHDVVLRCEGR